MAITTEQFKEKYPEIVDGDSISLRYFGDMVNIYNKLKKDGDVVTIHLLGLEQMISDFKYITRPERVKKLERILGNDKCR